MIRILTVRSVLLGPLYEEGVADEWVRQLKATWRQQLHIIQIMGNRFGVAATETMRTLTQGVLTSKVCYGAVCFELIQAQHAQLETLHRKCLRVIKGPAEAQQD